MILNLKYSSKQFGCPIEKNYLMFNQCVLLFFLKNFNCTDLIKYIIKLKQIEQNVINFLIKNSCFIFFISISIVFQTRTQLIF